MSPGGREGCPETFLSPWLTQAGTSAEQARSTRKKRPCLFGQRGGSATKVFSKPLTTFLKKRGHRSEFRVILTGPPQDAWPGVLLHYRGWPGLKTPTLGRKVPSLPPPPAPCIAKEMGNLWHPLAKLCEYLQGEQRSPLQTDGIFWGVSKHLTFCKLEILSVLGKEEVSPLWQKLLALPPTPSRASEPEYHLCQSQNGGQSLIFRRPQLCPDVPALPPSTKPQAMPAVAAPACSSSVRR